MKHLTRNRAIRLPMLLALVVFAMCFVFPHPAIAKLDYAIGANATEGDPGDGLEYTSSGSEGDLLGEGKNLLSTRCIIIRKSSAPCNTQPPNAAPVLNFAR